MSQHLIHIGYPKAGSTFLQSWFEQHPEIQHTDGGLGGYRNIYEMCRVALVKSNSTKCLVTSFEGISAPFMVAQLVNQAAIKDFPRDDKIATSPISNSTNYLPTASSKPNYPSLVENREAQQKICAVLKTLYPGSRILIVTRGFRSMMLSGYSQYVRMGGVLSLRELLRARAPHPAWSVADYYDFDWLIKLYADAFGKQNLIILPYELLRDNQPAFLNILEKQLGVSHFEPNFGRLNPSLSAEELYWYPVLSRKVSALAPLLGDKWFRRLYRRYAARTLHNKLHLPIRGLQRLKPHGKITDADFPAEVLEHCRGKAESLRANPLYAPYAAEYLLD